MCWDLLRHRSVLGMGTRVRTRGARADIEVRARRHVSVRTGCKASGVDGGRCREEVRVVML